VSEVVCSRCRHRNPVSSNFCSACGAALLRHGPGEGEGEDATLVLTAADPTGDAAGGLGVESSAPALLVVRGGPEAGQVFELARTVTTLGRATDNDIFLDDVTVSRRHAVIVAGPGGWSVRDTGSLNGTYQNRHRIGEAPLSPGDEVQIGRFRLVFLRRGDSVADSDG
jgi:pSer/pThr/pTyr-binding forkhead associated (FHA) protein